MMTDEDLLRDFVRNRSRGAFEEIVRRHGGLVFGVCRRSLGDLQEAEDAAQSVFLLFLEKASRLGSGTVVAAWLYRTAVFVARNQIRARIRRESRPPLPAEEARDEGRHHLDEALARLPQRLQDALVAHYLQGKTLTETAAALDCPVKTIEKRVGRGLQRMRELLGGAGVTLSSAALVALLRSEANASAPAGLQTSLQSRPMAGVPKSALLKLALPAAAALVLISFVAGTARLSRKEAGAPLARENGSSTIPAARAETSPLPAGSRADPASIAVLPFPATFDEFTAKFRKLHQIPESLDLWRAIGIDLRPDELRDAVHRPQTGPVVIVLPVDDSAPYLVRGFEQWAKRDPRAAADWIFRAFALLPAGEGWKPELSFEDNEQTFLETVLSTWLSKDRNAVEAWIATLPPGPAAKWATTEYAIQASRQAARPFQELGTLVQGMQYSWERVAAVSAVAEQWARRDPEAAAAWMERLPFLPGPVSLVNDDEDSLRPLASRPRIDSGGDARRDPARCFAADRIGRSWAKIDSLAAVRWALGLSDPEESSYALTSIGDVWSLADPAAALRFATAQPDASWRTEWIRLAASRLAKDNLGDARAAIALLPSDIRANGTAEVLDQWASDRPREGALEAVRILTNIGGDQLSVVEGVLSRLSTRWTNEEPAAAAAWASSLEDPKLRELVCGCVGAAWAESDPRTALEWIRPLPNGEARARTVAAAIDALAPQDLDWARRLLSELKPGNLRLGALSAVAEAWAGSAPEVALAWGRALPDAADRSRSVLSVLSAWSFRDADAAKAAAEGLDVELRDEGLKMVEDGRVRARRDALREGLLREKGK